jgi:hypothetical protein
MINQLSVAQNELISAKAEHKFTQKEKTCASAYNETIDVLCKDLRGWLGKKGITVEACKKRLFNAAQCIGEINTLVNEVKEKAEKAKKADH